MNYSTWGDKIKVMHLGMWGHDANSFEYTYSGAKGHYPNTTFRFSRYGNNSIDRYKYSDIEIKESDFKVGYSNGLFRIDEIIKTER